MGNMDDLREELFVEVSSGRLDEGAKPYGESERITPSSEGIMCIRRS